MFDIGGGEMVVLIIAAIFIFGPDKLPKVAGDAARMIRRFREFAQGARSDIRRELGPEFRDVDFADLNPRTFVRKNVLSPDDLDLDHLRDENLFDNEVVPSKRRSRPQVRPGERPPYDADAT
ncbi:MAG: sec-independent translocase [Carbonactinosporaceae bacterium]